jgi:hypothetical protein
MLARAGQGLAALVAIVCIAGCGARSPSAQVSNGVFMNESLGVALTGTGVSPAAFTTALTNLISAAPARGVNISVSPDYASRSGTRAIGTARFLAALDDAAEKARALARHAGLTLGEVESIAEGYAGAPSRPDGQALKGSMPSMTANTVQTSLNGPVVIAVVYRVAGGDPGRTISVLGLASDAATPQAFGNASSGQFRININARGSDLKDAAALVERYESLVHKAAAQAGLRDAAITKMEFSFNIN